MKVETHAVTHCDKSSLHRCGAPSETAYNWRRRDAGRVRRSRPSGFLPNRARWRASFIGDDAMHNIDAAPVRRRVLGGKAAAELG
jgi:hypothetical protein